MPTSRHPAVDRLVRDHQCEETLTLLGSKLSGSDTTTLLLEAAARRAELRSPAAVLRQYEHDRFVAPGEVDAITMAQLHLLALQAASPLYEPVLLAPVAPLATHSVFGAVPQNNVVTTVRMTEVAADPSNSLALEAATRRRALLADAPASITPVRLAAAHRVLRAQRFEGPRSFAHFSQFGLATAGRDLGSGRFELDALGEQLETLIGFVRSTVPDAVVEVLLSDCAGSHGQLLADLSTRIETDDVTCVEWGERALGRGYYYPLCFKISVLIDDEIFEVGDGGLVDWTQLLVPSNKERLAISGLGLDRLAMCADAGGAKE